MIAFSTYPASTGRQVCTSPSHYLAQTGRGKWSRNFFTILPKLENMDSCSTPQLPGWGGRAQAAAAFSRFQPQSGPHPQAKGTLSHCTAETCKRHTFKKFSHCLYENDEHDSASTLSAALQKPVGARKPQRGHHLIT